LNGHRQGMSTQHGVFQNDLEVCSKSMFDKHASLCVQAERPINHLCRQRVYILCTLGHKLHMHNTQGSLTRRWVNNKSGSSTCTTWCKVWCHIGTGTCCWQSKSFITRGFPTKHSRKVPSTAFRGLFCTSSRRGRDRAKFRRLDDGMSHEDQTKTMCVQSASSEILGRNGLCTIHRANSHLSLLEQCRQNLV